jgi:hypothetical protein
MYWRDARAREVSMTLKVCLAGATGWAGSELARGVAASADWMPCWSFDPASLDQVRAVASVLPCDAGGNASSSCFLRPCRFCEVWSIIARIWLITCRNWYGCT